MPPVPEEDNKKSNVEDIADVNGIIKVFF